jgi:hypothetical protein
MKTSTKGNLRKFPAGLIGMALLISALIISGGKAYAQGDGLAGSATPQPTPSGVPTLNPDTLVTSTNVVSEYLTVKNLTLPDGARLTESIINGPPKPPGGFAAEQASALEMTPASATILPNVPTFKWVMGCSAVSGSMIAGYYDRTGYPNMYTGPTAGGVYPLVEDPAWGSWSDGTASYPNNPLIGSHNGSDGRATRGSIDDYWVSYGSSASDPFITGSWTQHAWGSAISDYMKTSQSSYGNTDGSTSFYSLGATKLSCSAMTNYGISQNDGTYGRKLFYEARGYTVTDCYAQSTDNQASGGFSLANYKAEINAGHPVFLNLAGHSIVGVGYDTASTTIYIHDTWDNNTHSMVWGGSYSGMVLQSVSIVNLAPLTYTISGNAGVASATISFTGGSTTADGTGVYSFSVPSGWTGVVTPSKTGYTFTPVNKSYSNVTTNQAAQNYTATPNPYTISGNAGVASATISYPGGSTTADSAGVYSFTVPSGWSGTVTPAKTGYTFTPASTSYTNVTTNQSSQNYSAALKTYTISGNTGVASATINYPGGSTAADGTGVYSFIVNYAWSGTVTPVKTGYTFTPNHRDYSNITANQPTQNYSGALNTYAISGNAGVGSATITYTGGSTPANEAGVYSFSVSYGWSGTVTPTKPGYTFTLDHRDYSNVTSNQAAQNYSAAINTYTIAGNAGVGGAFISYSGGSTTADGTGDYSFSVPYGWIGTVRPFTLCTSFDPVDRSLINVQENHSGQNFNTAPAVPCYLIYLPQIMR